MTGRLERRYRRLLRAYPMDYRAERGDELVGTYLDTMAPGRAWPGVRDATDVLAGGFRQRLRARGASGLPGGASVAAVLALATGSLLATCWMLVIELRPSDYAPAQMFAPFRTPAAYAWLVWLAAAAAFAAGWGRWSRRLIGLALVLSVVAKPVALLALGNLSWYLEGAFTNWGQYAVAGSSADPSGLVLLPMVALGVGALAVPSHPGRLVRWAPLLAALVPIAPALRVQRYWPYADLADSVFQLVAPTLLAAAVIVMIVLLHRRDARAPWVPLVLLTPTALLLIQAVLDAQIAFVAGRGWYAQFWYEPSIVSVLLILVTVGVLALAIAITGRRGKTTPADYEARTP